MSNLISSYLSLNICFVDHMQIAQEESLFWPIHQFFFSGSCSARVYLFAAFCMQLSLCCLLRILCSCNLCLPLQSVQTLFILRSCCWCSQGRCFPGATGRVTISGVCSLFCKTIRLLKLKPLTWKALGYEAKGFGRGSKINNK